MTGSADSSILGRTMTTLREAARPARPGLAPRV